MNAFARIATVASLSATWISLASPAAAADAAACKPLDHLQRRVVEKADQGVDALRQYILITRGVYQLDMMKVAGSLDAWRTRAGCTAQAPAGTATR